MLGLRLVRFVFTDTVLVPEPTDCDAVALYVANELLVPHSNHAFVGRPFGLALPLSVALVDPMLAAVLVDTIGAPVPVTVCALAA